MGKEDYKKLGEYAMGVTDWVLKYRDEMEKESKLKKYGPGRQPTSY